MKNLIYIIVFILGITSCDKNEGAYYPVPSDFSVTPSTPQSIEANGGIIELTISAGNLGWWIESSEGWCKVSRKYGSGDSKVTLTIEKNVSGATRQCVIKVNPTFKKESVEIIINQQ